MLQNAEKKDSFACNHCVRGDNYRHIGGGAETFNEIPKRSAIGSW